MILPYWTLLCLVINLFFCAVVPKSPTLGCDEIPERLVEGSGSISHQFFFHCNSRWAPGLPGIVRTVRLKAVGGGLLYSLVFVGEGTVGRSG